MKNRLLDGNHWQALQYVYKVFFIFDQKDGLELTSLQYPKYL